MDDIKTVKAGSIIFDKDDNVLIIQQTSNDTWSFPKGSLKDGETIYEGSVRETLEETGFDISPYTPIGIYETYQYESKIVFLIYKMNKDIDIDITPDNKGFKWLSFKSFDVDFFKENTFNKLTYLYFKKAIQYKPIKNGQLNKIKKYRYRLKTEKRKRNNNNKNKNTKKLKLKVINYQK